MLGRRRKPSGPVPGDGDAAPGWDAIERCLAEVYGPQEPHHVGYVPGLAFGSGLQGCSAYWAGDHWHYVTYGLTELWAKEGGADPLVSGWGYELTLRAVGEDRPPPWPFDLLEKIARHTRAESHPFHDGDRLDTGGPITGGPGTRLTAVAFTQDPGLAPVATPNGSVGFRQVVGITADELALMRATSTGEVLDRLRAVDPWLVTDPSR
jgi:Suppressor of fused protein (SUFU)